MDTPLYLRVRGRVLGPYDQEKLQSLARRGQLSRMHEVSTDGVRWVRASTYAELFVGAPVKLAIPEMRVAPPAGAPKSASEDIPFAEEAPPEAATAQPLAPAAGRSWYYENAGTQCGPIDEAALRQMLMTGQLDANARVWNDGMAQWTPASQVPALVATAATGNTGTAGNMPLRSSDAMLSLCKTARASRPWVMFLAIVAFVYAGLVILAGFLQLIVGAGKGIPTMVASGLFLIIAGALAGTCGILLASYSARLASLAYSPAPEVLESALERLKTFWVFISIVSIVALAFLVFSAIWVFAVGVSLSHYS